MIKFLNTRGRSATWNHEINYNWMYIARDQEGRWLLTRQNRRKMKMGIWIRMLSLAVTSSVLGRASLLGEDRVFRLCIASRKYILSVFFSCIANGDLSAFRDTLERLNAVIDLISRNILVISVETTVHSGGNMCQLSGYLCSYSCH